MAITAIRSHSKSARIEGLSELKVNIATILDRTTAESLKDVFLEAAQVLLQEFRADAPVGQAPEDEHPGLFRDSARVELGPANKPYAVFFVERAKVVDSKGRSYATVIEYGDSKGHPARHTIRNAVTTTRPMMYRIIADGFRKRLEETAKP